MRTLAITSALAIIAGCTPKAVVQSGTTTQTSPVCKPTAGDLRQGASLSTLTGDHRLTLVSSLGKSVMGTIHFDAPSKGMATGTAHIALDSLGAVVPGSPNSVTATQWLKPVNGATLPAITIRFGSTATPAGTPIEGSFMALQLTSLTPTTFTGTWASAVGGSTMDSATGYFCAARTP